MVVPAQDKTQKGIANEDKEEDKSSEESQQEKGSTSALATTAQEIIKKLPNIDKLPKLVAPTPLPGKYSKVSPPTILLTRVTHSANSSNTRV